MSTDDILFDRNSKNTDNIRPCSIQLVKLRQMINELSGQDLSPEAYAAKKRVIYKFLDIASIQDDINGFNEKSIIDDPDIIDEDMFMIGKIHGNELIIDIPPINININLTNAIGTAMFKKNISFIDLMLKLNLDIFQFEPKIMMMCVESELDGLMIKLIKRKIPIHTENYECIYQLVAKGKLELINNILADYFIPDFDDILIKICIYAILYDKLFILQYFFKPNIFVDRSDIAYCLFFKCIEYNNNIKFLNFFIENGIDITSFDYRAVHTAIKFNKTDVIQYFYDINNSIIQMLTPDETSKFNITILETLNRHVGIGLCHISYDEILENETYFQCCNNKHHLFKEQHWKSWIKSKMKWVCPLCLAPVNRILYTNKI